MQATVSSVFFGVLPALLKYTKAINKNAETSVMMILSALGVPETTKAVITLRIIIVIREKIITLFLLGGILLIIINF